MSRKNRREQPLLPAVEITGIAAEGNALARVADKVVFIPYGAPGDVADLRVVRSKRSFMEARIERLVTPAPDRVTPPCAHFGVCGGCRWQHLPYSAQLEAKRRQVADALDRIAKVPHPEPLPTLAADPVYGYRNKMEYTFSARRWLTRDEMLARAEDAQPEGGLGFHITGAFDKVLDITDCPLADDFSNRVRNFLRTLARERGLTFYDLREHTGLLRTLMVRTAVGTGQAMVFLAFGEDGDPDAVQGVLDALRGAFPEITSLVYAYNTKMNDSMEGLDIRLHSGQPYIEETLGKMRYRVQPRSFFQTNSRQALRLYETARDFAGLTGHETVYDLYTGAGTIACFVASGARRVVGVEYVEDAVADARVNAALNGVDNATFFAGDMKCVLTPEFIVANGQPDVMIVDPPRAGMHEDVVRVILDAAPARIVYVSCNPATQARDLALLHALYDIARVQPVDMFPHTHHVENVALLTLRPS